MRLDLSFFQKRDNLSKFTNACRSISIPDILLITYSYFENNDKNLLVSGLVTFFIWVLNLYISCSVLIVSGIVDSSEHVTINSLLKVSSDGDMSKSVDTIARRLSDRAGMVTGEIAVNEAGTCDASLVQNEADKSAVEQRDAEIHEKISQLTRQIKESEMEYKELLNEANAKKKAAPERRFFNRFVPFLRKNTA